MILGLMLIALAIALLSPPANAAQATLESIRIGIPGKLMDFAPFFVGAKTGIYRSEGLEPQFIVMRSGIIFPALLAGTVDFYLKAMSPDGRVSESIVYDLISEQKALVNVKTEVPLSQVADFRPLQRVVKELNIAK